MNLELKIEFFPSRSTLRFFLCSMGEEKENEVYEEELLDYEDEEEKAPNSVSAKGTGEVVKK